MYAAPSDGAAWQTTSRRCTGRHALQMAYWADITSVLRRL